MASNPTDDVNLECINVPPNVAAPSATAPAKTQPAVGSPSRDKQVNEPEWFEFQDLILKEFKCLHPEDWPPTAAPNAEAREANFQTADPGAGDEPSVVFTKRDYFGLALSGGGIRSATFNLGLLQGLNLNGILDHVDYLSTVSGGGYIGGFWTAWRHFNPTSASFPPQSDPTTKPRRMRDVRELGPFRHLREFSRFLLPRVGITQSETWSGIVTILAGLVPSLTATTALVTVAIFLWYGFNHWMLTTSTATAAVTLFVATLLLQVFHELSWRKQGKGGTAVGSWGDFIGCALTTAIAAVIGWTVWDYFLVNADAYEWLPNALGDWSAESPASNEGKYTFSAVWLGPAVAWFFGGVVMGVTRFLWSHSDEKDRAATIPTIGLLERCVYRCLAPALLWTVLVLGWEFTRWLHSWRHVPAFAGGSTLTFGALFLWFRDWLNAPIKETQGARLFRRLAIVLKPAIPQMLAWGAVISFLLMVTFLVQEHGLNSGIKALTVVLVALVVIFFALLLFDPARVGLHEFYRARIARCYLGGAHVLDPEVNRATAEQPDDDPLLGNLGAGLKSKPIHLVCCAANNIGGDILSGLYRGARSAVLSTNGISLGNYTAPLKDLRFSSALTASAAAFNSQMGRISMRLGPAVSMVMSALDLRLGLWVPHPLNPNRKRRSDFPGRFFLYEMFGQTRCEPVSTSEAVDLRRAQNKNPWSSATATRKKYKSRHLHLSDGAHFENLALYELIRRHCRYIIVSDCSADPEIAFDDLANALRCVREDFGVEIEIDVAKFRPGSDNRSEQHAVIGTIHYDGLQGCDKGTLIYFKPTLTGDEPPDVLQYQTRNAAFPHESTGDQFYDEAQWEAYRRLGEHAAKIVLGNPSSSKTNFVENLFLNASERWAPTPAHLPETFLGLTQRCATLEAEVRDHAPAALRCEFFPEVATSGLAPEIPRKPDDELRVVYFVMLAAQLMEDTWVGAELDTYWSHPLNQGWMHYFQRWASMPSFRRWWPVIRSLYSKGFGDFVKERFDIRVRDTDTKGRGDPEGRGAKLQLIIPKTPEDMTKIREGLAWKSWTERYGQPDETKLHALAYQLQLEDAPHAIQVGFLLYSQTNGGTTHAKTVQWKSQQLFVPHCLIGGGILARFLESVIGHFNNDPTIGELRVMLEEQSSPTPAPGEKPRPDDFSRKPRLDAANRYERVHNLNFYKSRGFTYLPPDDKGELRILVRNSGSNGKDSTCKGE